MANHDLQKKILFRPSSTQPPVGYSGDSSSMNKVHDPATRSDSSRLELSRSRSPQSDAGYGTSLDSIESRGQRSRREIDMDGLSELLVIVLMHLVNYLPRYIMMSSVYPVIG